MWNVTFFFTPALSDGGNYNSTTRFRRYDGNEAAIMEAGLRPSILKEYTDAEHLLKANHWYHIKITNENNRVSYYIDGKRLVDFRDTEPLTEGWFGFRTTLSRTRLPVIRDLNIKVREHEVVAVAGSSGSGKSLLAHAVMGLLPQNAACQVSHRSCA